MTAAEFWLRGPVPGIPALLQPVAHALLQCRWEVGTLLEGFPEALFWERPAHLASPGFHVQHLAGVLDRLFTYAEERALSQQQLAELNAEGEPFPGAMSVRECLDRFNLQIDNALQKLAQTREADLTADRVVGRARLPSTVIGLLFHAAEHSMRHTGQLLVTARILGSHQMSGNRGDQ